MPEGGFRHGMSLEVRWLTAVVAAKLVSHGGLKINNDRLVGLKGCNVRRPNRPVGGGHLLYTRVIYVWRSTQATDKKHM